MATLTLATLGMACLELLQVPPQLVGAFTVQHYAQRVRYEVAGFVEKNRDALPDEVRRLMRSSGFGLAASLFKESAPAATDGGSAGGSGTGDNGAGGGAGGGAAGWGLLRAGVGRRGGGGKPTKRGLCAQFSLSLDELMATLRATHVHFARCVKPNEQMAAGVLRLPYVLTQLRYMGMLEVVRARQRGWAVRYPHADFAARFGELLDETATAGVAATPPRPSPPPLPSPVGREACRGVAQGLEARGVLPAGLWAMGKTKVYLKQAAQQRLESEHEQMARRRQERALRVALEARDLTTLRAAVAEAMRLRMGGALVRPRTRLGVPTPPPTPAPSFQTPGTPPTPTPAPFSAQPPERPLSSTRARRANAACVT